MPETKNNTYWHHTQNRHSEDCAILYSCDLAYAKINDPMTGVNLIETKCSSFFNHGRAEAIYDYEGRCCE